jgi:hypothetical protein
MVFVRYTDDEYEKEYVSKYTSVKNSTRKNGEENFNLLNELILNMDYHGSGADLCLQSDPLYYSQRSIGYKRI